MASRNFDFKAAPSFDIECESHLFDQWKAKWEGYEALSGISATAAGDKKEKIRLQAFHLAVSKETLRVVQLLPVEDAGSLDDVRLPSCVARASN